MKRLALMLVAGMVLTACQEMTTEPGSVSFAARGCEPGPPADRGGGKPENPGPPPDVGCRPVATVEVVPNAAVVERGETIQLDAVLRDRLGNLISNRTTTWSSSDLAVVTVDQNGLVTGLAVGQATIGAAAEGESGAATITVVYPAVDWQELSNGVAPSPRLGPGLVYHEALGQALLVAGIPFPVWQLAFKDTWLFDGATWSQLNVIGPQTSVMGITYDPVRELTVVFGGSKGYPLNRTDETWEFDGSGWTQRHPVHHPGIRSQMGMDYDRAHGHTVLYGGLTQSDLILDDVWTYDGVDWTFVGAGQPGTRADHVFVYDRSRDVFVLHGGLDNDRNILGDTWEYDGDTWTLIASATDLPLFTHAATWSEALGAIVMFGGIDPNSDFNESTWVFRDHDWHALEVENMPPVRRHAGFTSMGPHGDLLFGGWNGTYPNAINVLGDTWQLVRR